MTVLLVSGKRCFNPEISLYCCTYEGRMPEMAKVILGFSGGLDTSYCAIVLREQGLEPVCVTVDVGQGVDVEAMQQAAAKLDIQDLRIINAKRQFAEAFVTPAIWANSLYQGVYPLATALSRPLISKIMVDVANELGTNLFAHGCTGKGNDQLRMEMAIKALHPRAEIFAPIRDNNLSRDEEIEFLEGRGIQTGITKAKPYSIDQNLWGRSVCAGVLEDIAHKVPADAYDWTKDPAECDARGTTVAIEFEGGVPIAVNGERVGVDTLIAKLNELAGRHGIGRIDHIEDRVIGVKSREVYEAPAAITLITAHKALESLTLTRSGIAFKRRVDEEYAELIYLGNWFSAHHFDLVAYLRSNQRLVCGTIELHLVRGNIVINSRSSPNSLYRPSMITYSQGSEFDQRMAKGFVDITIGESSAAARTQLLNFDRQYKQLLNNSD